MNRIPISTARVAEFAQQFRVVSDTRQEALGPLQIRDGHLTKPPRLYINSFASVLNFFSAFAQQFEFTY